MQTQEERDQLLTTLKEVLPTWANKYVKVVMRKTKDVVDPGDKIGYFLVEYFGDIQNPAIRPYPEEVPEGVLCLYLKDRTAQQNVYALALSGIEEVDDEVSAPVPREVNMSALVNPNTTT